MFDAVVLVLLLVLVAADWLPSLSRTRKLMSGLTDLQTAVAANTAAVEANTTATNDAIAALQSAQAGGGDSDSAVAALAATLAANNADLTTNNNSLADAVAKFQGGGTPGALTIVTTSLTDGVAGAPYTAQLNITGGVAPITTTISGLPDGLTDQGAGLFSGTPTTAGTSTLSVSSTDSSSPPQIATATLTLVVDAAGA